MTTGLYSIYLAGPIEKTTDGGRGIRQEIHTSGIMQEMLRKYSCIINDPCDFKVNAKYKSFAETRKHEADWCNIVRNIVITDLQAVENSDAIIAIINPCLSFGTVAEISLALHKGIPVFAYVQGVDLNEMHPWVSACITKTAYSIEELTQNIEEFCQSQLPYQK